MIDKTEQRLLRQQEYWDRFENYSLAIERVEIGESNDNSSNMAEVTLSTQDNQRYHSNFLTLEYARRHLALSRETEGGPKERYVGIPHVVLVTDTEEATIRGVVEDLIEDFSLEDHFSLLE